MKNIFLPIYSDFLDLKVYPKAKSQTLLGNIMWNGKPTFQVNRIKRVMRKRRELVRLLHDEKIKEVEKFLKENAKYCSSNNSLMKLANLLVDVLDRKQFKVFALLKAHGFTMPFEGKDQRFEKLSASELAQLQNEVQKHFVLPDVYLKLHTDMTPLVKKLMLKTRLTSYCNCTGDFHKMRKLLKFDQS